MKHRIHIAHLQKFIVYNASFSYKVWVFTVKNNEIVLATFVGRVCFEEQFELLVNWVKYKFYLFIILLIIYYFFYVRKLNLTFKLICWDFFNQIRKFPYWVFEVPVLIYILRKRMLFSKFPSTWITYAWQTLNHRYIVNTINNLEWLCVIVVKIG